MTRDPFPMSSPEAKELADSVDGNKNLSTWNNMNTTSAEKGPSDAHVEEVEGNESLTTNSNKKNGDDDDIYSDIDKPEPDDEDAFLDRPLFEHRASFFGKLWYTFRRFMHKLYIRLYGDKLSPWEMLKTLSLAMTLFFMIGGYWLLRSLKDPVLTALCGVEMIPLAKMVSVFVVLAVVTIYNKLLDSSIPRHKLFYIFGTFYFCCFTAIALLLKHPTIGLPNEQVDPTRILGWISYCSIESFGSVMVSLFWSFANSSFSLETAKASYGIMVATAQVGSILGPTVVQQFSETRGVAWCYLVGALCMLLLQGTMYAYISVYGVGIPATSGSKPKAGILEGLTLFYEHNYVKGIFAISCLFMVEVTIVDYTMKVLAHDYFTQESPCQEGMTCWQDNGNHGMSEEATAGFATFMGVFGQATNTLSFLLSLLGTSAVIRYLGLRLTLLLFPTLCLVVIICVRLRPTLYVVFGAMIMLKACSYALNNPTKEMLYQPTSAGVKYKAKSWIDIFGARGSKALGSVVTHAFSDSASHLVANGSLVGMAVATFLIWNAKYMGQKFDEYTESGFIVGEEEQDDKGDPLLEDDIQMAQVQNDDSQDGTSCAVPDDDEEIGPEEEGQSSDEGERKQAAAQVTMV